MGYDLSAVMSSKLFEGFSVSEFDIFSSVMKPELKKYQKNEIIIHEGDVMDYVGILCSGKISKAKLDFSGDIHLLEILGKSKTFGMEIAGTPSQISPIMITCVEAATLLAFRHERILHEEGIPAEIRMKAIGNIIHLISNDSVKKLYKIEALSQKSLRGKIWTYLYLMEEKAGQPTFKINLNREQLSEYLCVNRSALSHELSLMQQEGLISFRKNSFTIHH